MHKPLVEMREERIASIEDALTQLEQRDHAQTGLHNLQAHLLNLLELIERNAGITAAVDDLLSTATAFHEGDHPARARKQSINPEPGMDAQDARDSIEQAGPTQAPHLDARQLHR